MSDYVDQPEDPDDLENEEYIMDPFLEFFFYYLLSLLLRHST